MHINDDQVRNGEIIARAASKHDWVKEIVLLATSFKFWVKRMRISLLLVADRLFWSFKHYSISLNEWGRKKPGSLFYWLLSTLLTFLIL